MSGSDRTATNHGPPVSLRSDQAARTSAPEADSDGQTARSFWPAISLPPVFATDGGTNGDRPLSERSRKSIEAEIDDLEQNPEQYETQDQAVIDRYEGLLAERQRRQREADTDRENEHTRHLRNVKNRLLRMFRLR